MENLADDGGGDGSPVCGIIAVGKEDKEDTDELGDDGADEGGSDIVGL